MNWIIPFIPANKWISALPVCLEERTGVREQSAADPNPDRLTPRQILTQLERSVAVDIVLDRPLRDASTELEAGVVVETVVNAA